jgi:hypothetical protein
MAILRVPRRATGGTPRRQTAARLPAKVKLTAAQARAMLALMDRRDPVRQWAERLGPTTRRCAESPTLYRLVNGGNQVGKTTYAIWECAAILRGIHPWKPSFGPLKVLIVVPYRLTAVAVWGKRLLESSELPGDLGSLPFIPPDEVEKVYWNYSGSGKAPGRIVLKNGSEAYFAWSASESMWEGIQGIMFDYVFRDEAVGNQKLGPELYMRLIRARDNNAKPWAGGILWVGTPTLQNEEYEEFQRNCHAQKADYAEFFIAPEENTSISMATREDMRDTMSDEDAAVRLDGGASEADRRRIYRRQWSDDRHVAAEDYEPSPTDNLWIAFDPGIGHPAGILCAAIREDSPRTIRVVRFYCHKDQPLTYHVACMRDWLAGRDAEGLVVDPKAFTRESTGKSIVTQITEAITDGSAGFRVRRGIIRGRNGHWEGINQVREYLDPRPGDPTAPPLVQINPLSPGCGLLRYQLTSYRGREETKYTGPHGVVKKNDEGPDCLRYLITVGPYYEPRGAQAARLTPVPAAPEPASPEQAMLARSAARVERELLASGVTDEGFPVMEAGTFAGFGLD